jgi:hypothetical protein
MIFTPAHEPAGLAKPLSVRTTTLECELTGNHLGTRHTSSTLLGPKILSSARLRARIRLVAEDRRVRILR